MKLLSAHLLATFALLLAGGVVNGQVQQTGHRHCHACNGGSYVGYQASSWNDGQSHMYGASGDPCFANGRFRGRQYGGCPGGLSAGDFWTRNCLGDGCVGQCIATKAFPDSGFAPPVLLPVNYDGAWYAAYHPQAFYGSPGGGFIANYPLVYQPTDTTQLGYYYRKVPTWQSRPGMIPPVPQPANYHARMFLGHGCGYGNNSGMSTGNACSTGYRPHFKPNMMSARGDGGPVSPLHRWYVRFQNGTH